MIPIVYGKPDGVGTFINEYYCSICNKIPVSDVYIDGAKVGKIIEPLNALNLVKLINGIQYPYISMTCRSCLVRIENSMREILKKKSSDSPPLPQ
jgi:uncharacterized protein YlbG (UPF0298 family)